MYARGLGARKERCGRAVGARVWKEWRLLSSRCKMCNSALYTARGYDACSWRSGDGVLA